MNSYSAFDQLVQKLQRQCQPSLAEREAERMDRALRKTEQADRILRELERTDRVSGMLPKRPFDSLLKSQEALSRLAKDLTPRADLISPHASAPTFEDPMKWLSDVRVPVESMKLKFPKFPKNHSLAELERMSDDEIREVLGGNVSIQTVQLARHVREMRQLERMNKPHWSVSWMFWVGLGSFILAVLALMI